MLSGLTRNLVSPLSTIIYIDTPVPGPQSSTLMQSLTKALFFVQQRMPSSLLGHNMGHLQFKEGRFLWLTACSWVSVHSAGLKAGRHGRGASQRISRPGGGTGEAAKPSFLFIPSRPQAFWVVPLTPSYTQNYAQPFSGLI